MSKPKIINEIPMSMVEVKAELNKIKKRDGELSFRANKTEDYLNYFTTLSQKKTKEIYKSLEDLNIPRLKDVHIIKLIDILPTHTDDVKAVLQGYATLTVSQENQKKIASTIKGHVETK